MNEPELLGMNLFMGIDVRKITRLGRLAGACPAGGKKETCHHRTRGLSDEEAWVVAMVEQGLDDRGDPDGACQKPNTPAVMGW
jgi:hypothetical protein